MNVHDVLSSPVSMRLALAFLHFLWQGLAIALLAFVAAKTLGQKSARVRHGVYMAALVAMLVCVAVTYAVVQVPPAGRGSEAVHDRSAASASLHDADAGEAAVTVAAEAVDVGALDPAAHRAADADRSFSALLLGQARQAAPYAVGIYLAGVVLMLGRLLLGLQGGGRLRRRSRPVDDPAILAALGQQARALGLAIAPALAYCSRVLVPTVVGVFRPIILLPFSFASGLAAEQVEALLAHELAHIRRLDPLLNVVQRVIEALLFFHPAVWCVSHRIRVEREHCCDDLVVGVSASASTYASSLVEAARRGLQGRAPARLAPQGIGLADRPSRLRARIARLLGQQAHERMRLRWTWLMGLVLAVSVGLVATVSLGGGAAREADGGMGGGTTTGETGSSAGAADGILEILGGGGDPDALLQVDLDLQLGRIDGTVLGDILKKVAPDSGDPSLRPLVLSVEQREALDAALAELPEETLQWRSVPRLRTCNRTRASIEVVGKQENEGDPVDAVAFSCAPVVSADGKSIVLVLFSKTVKGKPAGSLRFGADAVQLPDTDEGGLMAAYRIPNGGTLVLTGPNGIPAGRGPGVGGRAVPGGRPPGARVPGAMGSGRGGAGGFPHVQLALVRARTVNEEAAAARQRMLEKLNTRIPQVDFKDAPLREVFNFLGREMDVNIVVDPTAFPDAEAADGNVTLTLNDMPFGEVLKHLLRQKGLRYIVEDHALVVARADDTTGKDGAVAPGVAEAAAALGRIIEKLNTRIPQVDFKDAPLKEVLNYLGREMDVNIVIGPAALKHLEQADGGVTLSVKDMPLRDILRHLLKQKGLKFTVESNAIVVVPIDDEPAEEMKTEVFHLLVSGERTIVPPNGERREETIDEWLRRAEGVAWPAGSTITYDKRTETLTVENAPGNMGAIYAKIRAWNRGAAETNPPGIRAIIRTTALTGSENAAGEKITTARYNLQASGTRTVSDAGGERRIETIDEWLRGAEGVTWPEGSRLVYDARIELLVVSTTAENMAVIRELVKAWEAQDGDAAADAPGEGIHEKDAN